MLIRFPAPIGYRHWKRGQADKDTGDYKEVYTWGFVPVGVNITPRSRPRSYALGFDLAILLPLSPRLDARLHGIESALRNTKVDLPWRPGLRVQIPMSYKFSRRWSICLNPTYNYWTFGNSELKAAGAGLVISEPAGTTHCLRVTLGISYIW